MKVSENVHLLLILVCLSVVLCRGQTEPSMSAMEKEEQEALYSTVQGFVGKWWNGSDLYPDPCGWTPIQGVSCDLYGGFWYVSELKIGLTFENSLQCNESAIFTHHLFELKYLRSLSFFNCFLSSSQNPIAIPSSNWEKFTHTLESLEFRSNQGLVGSIPTSLGVLRQLQSLVIIETGVSGNIPVEIGNFVKLRRLLLSENQLEGQIPAIVGRLDQLLIFDLSRNNLSGELPLSIGGLKSLLKLDLSSNNFEGEIPEGIGRLRNLTLLDLGANKFSGQLPTSLQDMVSLKEMVISNNPMGGDLMKIRWKNMQNLEIMDLSNMGLTGEIPESIAELRTIRYLGFNDNYLTGTPSSSLSSLPSIGTLYLYGNNFTGELEFSEAFYRTLGKRFGAWNNPKLCFRDELILKGNYPHGVKPCRRENKGSENS